MAIHITGDAMTMKSGYRVLATARFSQHVAANGDGAWIVSAHPARLFTRDQAITRADGRRAGEGGHPDSHPLMVALQVELR